MYCICIARDQIPAKFIQIFGVNINLNIYLFSGDLRQYWSFCVCLCLAMEIIFINNCKQKCLNHVFTHSPLFSFSSRPLSFKIFTKLYMKISPQNCWELHPRWYNLKAGMLTTIPQQIITMYKEFCPILETRFMIWLVTHALTYDS